MRYYPTCCHSDTWGVLERAKLVGRSEKGVGGVARCFLKSFIERPS